MLRQCSLCAARACLLRLGHGVLAGLLTLSPVAGLAQSTSWRTVNQTASWLNVVADHAVGTSTALWFDGHWRRMGLGAEPQQVLLRPGVQFTLRPGVRIGGGYAYIATAPYGRVPSADPSREHRTWQQVSVAHSIAGARISHRVRWEQRWSASLLADGALGARSYQQRARYNIRAQQPLADVRIGGRPIVGFVWDEFFLPVGHSDGRTWRLQNRVGAGVGLPLDDRRRLEIGYMNQWNRITPAETHEINHTLVISWIWRYSQ